MITLLSPAKSLDYTRSALRACTLPRMTDDVHQLVEVMQKKKPADLSKMMSISDSLADLNYARFQTFEGDFTTKNSKQAILAFNGDVYQGLDNATLSGRDLAWAQNHVRILSGLYGILRPKDLIQPYRLEMGVRLATNRGKDLYDWWGNTITEQLNEDVSRHGSRVIFNLASNEYFHSVKPQLLKAKLYSANFFERRNGEVRFISFTAKRARGWLTRYIIDNRIDRIGGVKDFTGEGFQLDAERSTRTDFVFVREG